ncbi:MAG: hypothetical protein LBL01_00470 [Bifidobacteriaceae bacterium]|jgi:hypothetical protein|nr:hypothetical protein [Bifidobacteriaceae bacterium]
MHILERRVQVLFSKEQYRALKACAVAESRSVGSLIRDAVEKRVGDGADTRQRAFDTFLALADSAPDATMTEEEWRRVKHQGQDLVFEAP